MIQLVQPADGHVTQPFGNIQPDGLPHAGQDYAYYSGGKVTDAVYAAADGIVLFAGDSRNLGWPNVMYLNPDFDRGDNVDSSAGNYIIIQHHRGGKAVALTGYGHLENYSVKAGDIVKARQRIATIGQTGYSFGKHLHFDLMFYPLNYQTPTYGKSDPNPYFVGSLSYASESITPLEELDVAAVDDLQATLNQVLLRIDQTVEWTDSRINQLAGFVRDVVNGKESLTPEQLEAKLKEFAAANSRSEGERLYIGDAAPEVYVWDAGTGYRHIGQDEYNALVAAGASLTQLPQSMIDAGVGGK